MTAKVFEAASAIENIHKPRDFLAFSAGTNSSDSRIFNRRRSSPYLRKFLVDKNGYFRLYLWNSEH